MILNITPDHLDRHKTFVNYVGAKARVFENQRADDYAVLNADEPTTTGLSDRTRAQVFWFSRSKEIEKGAFARGTHIYFRDGHREREIMPLADVPLKGAHNLENVLAGVSIGMLVGCQPEQIRQAVRNFKAVEHRLEFVAKVAGVDYYNDSKATNVDATIKALESFPANIHLILGGKDKGSDYTVLNDLLRQRVKRVYTIGAAAAKIESQIQGAAEVEHAETLENAVRRASESAVAGDVVTSCSGLRQLRSVPELRTSRARVQRDGAYIGDGAIHIGVPFKVADDGGLGSALDGAEPRHHTNWEPTQLSLFLNPGVKLLHVSVSPW